MRKGTNLLWGLFFLLAGAAIVVGQFVDLQVNLFHIIISVFLLICALGNITNRNWVLVIMPIAYVVWMNRTVLGISEYISFWPLMWAGGFATVGLYIIFRKDYNYKRRYTRTFDHHGRNESGDATDDVVELSTTMSGSSQYLYSTNLQRVKISCTLGSLQVYFDQAIPSENGTVVDINCELGSVELYLPREWNIINNMSATLGGVDETRKHSNLSAEERKHTVTIQGNVTLGSVDIIYI